MKKVEIYHVRANTPTHNYSLCGIKSENMIGCYSNGTVARVVKGFNGFARLCKKCEKQLKEKQ